MVMGGKHHRKYGRNRLNENGFGDMGMIMVMEEWGFSMEMVAEDHNL